MSFMGHLRKEEKIFCVAMLRLVSKIFGNIPGAKVGGIIIDSTCMWWGKDDCGVQGSCLIYSRYLLRIVYLGSVLGIYFLIYLAYCGFTFTRPRDGTAARS